MVIASTTSLQNAPEAKTEPGTRIAALNENLRKREAGVQGRILCVLFCALSLVLLGGNGQVAAAAPKASAGHPRISQWTLPLGKYEPGSIVAGNGDSAWFAINDYSPRLSAHEAEVERITASGGRSPFPVGPYVWDVARGPGGIWFSREGYVGQIGPDGEVRQFPVPTGSSDAFSLAAGPGGYMWLTKRNQSGRPAILRISRKGSVKAYPLPNRSSNPVEITRGSDGAMWFTEDFGRRIGRITASGKVTEYPLGVQPVGGLAYGPEGNIWFQTYGAIGRLSPSSGKVALFRRPGVGGPLVVGPDSHIWFAQDFGKIGRITPKGHFSVIALPGHVTTVKGLAVGQDGSVWYTAERQRTGQTGVVGRMLPAANASGPGRSPS